MKTMLTFIIVCFCLMSATSSDLKANDENQKNYEWFWLDREGVKHTKSELTNIIRKTLEVD